MLYEAIIKDGNVDSYVPTPLGTALLVTVFIVLLAAAVILARRRSLRGKESVPKPVSVKLTAKQMAFCAVSIAMGTVLSNVKLFDPPFGGSVTLLSMLFICLPGYWFGPGAGLMTGIAHGILQLTIEPYVIHPVQLLTDYPLAFGALGLSGLFTDKKNGLLKGYLAGIIGRWIFTSLSGWIFFAEYAWAGWAPLPYSLVYNGNYLFLEAAITLALLAIPPVKEAFARVKRMALE